MIFYVYKIFHEIIKFLDTASIYKIIRSRLLGFMMVTIGYIIIGVNFFIIYVLSLIMGFVIYTGIHVYVNYKRTKLKNYDIGTITNILILFGYTNHVVYILSQLEKVKLEGKLVHSHIKFKKDFYYNSVK